jgi:hypothetical protein
LNGFPLFDEQQLTPIRDFDQKKEQLFGKAQEYVAFLEHKRIKPVFDLYAAFQPFNESTQCIFPLIPLLREVLCPGDLILDLWCRTGWTGELLASFFPNSLSSRSGKVRPVCSASKVFIIGWERANAVRISILFFILQIIHFRFRTGCFPLCMASIHCTGTGTFR